MNPFLRQSLEAGAHRFTVYNHMYHPRAFFSEEEGGLCGELQHLQTKVAVINTSVQRQVRVRGPDAEAFVDLVVPRDVRGMRPNTAKYVILCNARGGIINDPVLLRLSADEFWFSCADSDVALWLQGVNCTGRHDVQIRELDVAPLNVAGPLASETMATLIGRSRVDDLPYFGLVRTRVRGLDVVVGRSGFSSELNYEIYLYDATRNAAALYDAVMSAGEPHGIREIAVSHASRIERGMLSYRQDADEDTNPFEVGLEWMLKRKLRSPVRDFIGKGALLDVERRGVTHKLVGLKMGGRPVRDYLESSLPVRCPAAEAPARSKKIDYQLVSLYGPTVGHVTSCWFSKRLQCNIALAFLPVELSANGQGVYVTLPKSLRYGDDRCVWGEVVPIPFGSSPRVISDFVKRV